MATVASVQTVDVRFPTSKELDGSDAVNVDPDYSAAYVIVHLDSGEQGHAFVFSCGRGNEILTCAIESYGALLVGRDADQLVGDLGEASRRLVHDSQLRWLGPEKGVTQMACGALVNALWDIRARREGMPLWWLLAEMSPAELVDVVDFTHIRNVLDPATALDILSNGQTGKPERIAALMADGIPAYTTSPGWLGYSDEKLLRLARQATDDGFGMIKLKVGGSLEDDRRRLALVRRELPDLAVAVDANQRWEVGEAIAWVRALAEFNPFWIEEPTSTDDVLGCVEVRTGVAPMRVAAGEAVHNRIMVKQFLQAHALDVLQLDATRVAGVNENLAILLLCAQAGVAVCPHAGGIGLCELVQHLSFFDHAVVAPDRTDRVIEYVDHLHEHFVHPVSLSRGRYRTPRAPGIGAEMRAESLARWAYPDGPAWGGAHPPMMSGPALPRQGAVPAQ